MRSPFPSPLLFSLRRIILTPQNRPGAPGLLFLSSRRPATDGFFYSLIPVTTPAPTVRPPSRMA
ncbi:MAG: hypothetical protein K6T80_05545, partial [Firmicutes bacterium]|nr:hypothetical protein [Bacillota bacterium]